MDRIEKAFFNDAGFENIDEIPTAVKIRKTKIPTAPPQQTSTPIVRRKTDPVLVSVPALIIYGSIFVLLGILLLNNQIYIIPHQNQLKGSTLVATDTWALSPESAKSHSNTQRVLMTIPAFSTNTLAITTKEPVNVESQYLALSIRSNTPEVTARLYVRDSNLLSNKFNPITLPVVTFQNKTAAVPVPLSNTLNEAGIRKQRITDFKIEFNNPTAQDVTVLVDKKIHLIPVTKVPPVHVD